LITVNRTINLIQLTRNMISQTLKIANYIN